jgi:hypothetical protein
MNAEWRYKLDLNISEYGPAMEQVINFWVPQKARKWFTSWASISFPWRRFFLGVDKIMNGCECLSYPTSNEREL